MKTYKLYKSDKSNKKYLIITPEGKKIYFGANGYSDYTKHKDDDRKERYIKRHKNRENWNNKNSAGFWSRWILWNKKTIKSSIKNTESRYKIKIQQRSGVPNV